MLTWLYTIPWVGPIILKPTVTLLVSGACWIAKQPPEGVKAICTTVFGVDCS